MHTSLGNIKDVDKSLSIIYSFSAFYNNGNTEIQCPNKGNG